MLNRIDISNFALIDNISLDFKSGYSAITGETGAGKSILLKALNLLLGERADYSIIKTNEKKCVLEAEFDISNLKLQSFFDEWDIDHDPNTVIRREFSQNGKSRLFVNDTPVNLNTLKALGEKLVMIHSQHETLDLFDRKFQLDTLDAFASQLELVDQYSTIYKNYTQSKKRLEELKGLESENRKEQDYISFLLKEFEDAKVDKLDLNDLFSRYEKIENWTKIQTQLQSTLAALQNRDNTTSSSIQHSIDSIQEIVTLSDTYQSIQDRLKSIKIELDDIETELEAEASGQELDEDQAQLITEQVDQINSLLYKHNAKDSETLLSTKQDLEDKLLGFSSVETEITSLSESIQKLETSLIQLAEDLHIQRTKTIPNLQEKTNKILAELGMPDAELKIELEKTTDLLPTGFNRIEYLFKTNLGGQFLPISKTASGGELSRLMLSILHIISSVKQLPTLIFDEIDSGVSGEIAAKMANLFDKMGQSSQLIAITHLPQIAGKATSHFYVSKSNQNNKASTKVVELKSEERVNELAKMMSGETISDKAVENAKLLLNH